MKDYDRRIRQGGDDAIAAACELADLAKERRGYEDVKNAQGDITDIVTVLRGVGFAAISPQADESASLLHYCVTHAADEIEQLRQMMPQWTLVSERLPNKNCFCLMAWPSCVEEGQPRMLVREAFYRADEMAFYFVECHAEQNERASHWMPLPTPPSP